MAARLTFKDCVAQLSEYVVPPQGSSELQPARFRRYLNQAADRLTQWMSFKGIFEYVIFPAANVTGIITLPPQYEAIVGVTQLTCPMPIFDQFSEFIENGAGTLDETVAQCTFGSIGSDYCLTTDMTAPSVITVEYAGTDPIQIRICGVDSSGNDIIDINGADGEVVTISSATTPDNTTATFANIRRIVKPETVLPVTIKSGTTTLVRLRPWETRPAYTRYKVGTRDVTLNCLCRRKHVPIIHDDDPVYPANVGALKHAVLALNYEDYNDAERATVNWDTAKMLLGAELRAARGSEHQSFRFQPYGWGNGNIQNLT